MQDLILHFGCRGKPGHYLTYPNGQSVRDFDCDRIGSPKPSDLDASPLFLPPERPGDGAITYLPAMDRTVLAWWDRTFDERGKCNMAIIVSGKATAEECWRRFSGRFADLAPKLKMPKVVCGGFTVGQKVAPG